MSKNNIKPNENVLVEINEILNGEPYISVVLAARLKEKDGITLAKLTLSKSAVKKLQEMTKDYLIKFDSTRFNKYDAGYKPDPDELCYLKLKERQKILEIVSSVSDTFDPQKNQSASKDFIDNLKFYAIVVRRKKSKQNVVFFRKTNKNIELSRKFITGLFLRGNHLSRLKQNVLLFDKNTDCFSFGDFMYVNNIHYFHQIFEYLEEMEKNAKKIAKTVKKKVAITNWKTFEEKTTSQQNMIAKLSRISQRQYFKKFDKNEIMERLEGFLKDHKDDDDVLKLTGIKKIKNKPYLKYDETSKCTWVILKILDDDFLDSPLWDFHYEVNSKRRMKKTPSSRSSKTKIPIGGVATAKKGKKKKSEHVAV